MKQKTANAMKRGDEVGDVWTWVAIDAESKLVPCFHIGDRTQASADTFSLKSAVGGKEWVISGRWV